MILVDTGAWLALADRGDAYHVRSSEFFRRNREPLMTTYPVLVESVHLMYKRTGITKTLAWLDALHTQGVGFHHDRNPLAPAGCPDAPIPRFAHGLGGCFLGTAG